MDMLPAQRTKFLGPRSGQKGQHGEGMEPVRRRLRSGVNDIDCRPAWPLGTWVSSTTFRFTRSRAMARRTERLRQLRTRCSVAVLSDADNSISHASTSRRSGRAIFGPRGTGSHACRRKSGTSPPSPFPDGRGRRPASPPQPDEPCSRPGLGRGRPRGPGLLAQIVLGLGLGTT
jgi:hypothetical protein